MMAREPTYNSAGDRPGAIGSASDGIVDIINPSGKGDFLIVCEHASRHIPSELNGLGLNEDIQRSHITWDPGALSVATALSAELDAPLVAQRISRLVYDCNRPSSDPSAVSARSEIFDIPGNANLSDDDRHARFEQYYVPFRDSLAGCIEYKLNRCYTPTLITIHSFTPVFKGIRRDVDIGILHDSDSRFADEILKTTRSNSAFTIRRNAPYGPEDGVTHTLAKHAVPRGLLNVMFEIKNDLIADNANQQSMAKWLSKFVLVAQNTLTQTIDDIRRERSTS